MFVCQVNKRLPSTLFKFGFIVVYISFSISMIEHFAGYRILSWHLSAFICHFVFVLAAFIILSLICIFRLSIMCSGKFPFWSNVFAALYASCTFIGRSFFRLGKSLIFVENIVCNSYMSFSLLYSYYWYFYNIPDLIGVLFYTRIYF